MLSTEPPHVGSPLLFGGVRGVGYPIEKFRKKFRGGVPPPMRTFKKGVEDRGVPPRSGGDPPMRVPGFLGWGTGFFWGVPRFFIDAPDR